VALYVYSLYFVCVYVGNHVSPFYTRVLTARCYIQERGFLTTWNNRLPHFTFGAGQTL